MKRIQILKNDWYMKEASEEIKEWLPCSMPSVVQEVLFDHDLLDREVLETGRAEKCTWVSERNWLFRTEFSAPPGSGTVYLEFLGLDTVVYISLNGEKLCRHESMFMPCKVDVTEKLQEKNVLLLHFYAPFNVVKEYEIPERYLGKIGPMGLLRKTHMDFSPHGGVVPFFTPIGVYDDVVLVRVDESEITYADIETELDRHCEDAVFHLALHRTAAEGVCAKLCLYAPDGGRIVEQVCDEWEMDDEDLPVCQMDIPIEKPLLWWPRNYGAQPLYKAEISLWKDGRLIDRIFRTVGFRKIETIGDMRFRINGKEIKLWGTATTPFWGCSHKWVPERAKELLDFAVRGNMNAIRLWGPGQPYNAELYEYASEMGILIWQEFHLSGAYVPDLSWFTDMVMEEAKIEVRRLKHYPCIFMWCGGNENFYMLDIFSPTEKNEIGYDLLRYRLKDLVAQMDPHRYYHMSSPCDGRFPNEAVFGDNHGSRAAQCYLPGEAYAHFFSENIRTSVPELKSLKRFIPKDQLWPEGYNNAMPFGSNYPMPDSWRERTINNFEKKTGPYELFYDATDAESLVYRLNAAAAYDIREILTKQRQGKPFYESAGERRCNGHLFWKLACPWPQIYCAFIDYYLEPGQPYYMLRRCYAPVCISIDMQDHIYIWGVNDSVGDFEGTVTVEVCELDSNQITQKIQFPAGIPEGDSLVLKSLDCFGHIQLRSVIHATLSDRNGEVVSEDFQYLIAERRLPFSDAQLSVRQEGDSIVVGTDLFARCVELNGDEKGDAFGWKFEDNYFDLMPGQERRIKIFGSHKSGVITAKAHYAIKTASAQWRMPEGFSL